MTRKLFGRIKKLNFISISLDNSNMDWNYTGTGKVMTIEKDDKVYFFEEINLDNGLRLNDKKMWKMDDKALRIEFYHYRNNEYEKIFDFFLKNKNYMMGKKYECYPDIYSGKIKIVENGIHFIVKIKGVRKNEEITYHYEE